MNRLATDKRAHVVAALVEGTSINATCRMTGVAKHTVLKLLKDLGCAAASYHDAHVRNLHVRRVQCDEIWSFVYAKAKNAPVEQLSKGAGDCWTWTAIDADTKLIISYVLGDRGAKTATALMQDLATRMSSRFQLTSDGHHIYIDAVEDAFGADIDYAMLQKIYGAPTDAPETRYSPATCIGCKTAIVTGNPDPNHISTSFVERSNLSMRMGMRRFTRLTNGFSKKLENHGHMVALYFFHYNFIRIHQTLRVTPAMEAGITDHVWSLEELVALLDVTQPPKERKGMAFSEETKSAALRRSGYQCECRRSNCGHAGRRCMTSLVTGRWHAHHKTSVLAGGSDTLDNCEALCIPCHENTHSYGRS